MKTVVEGLEWHSDGKDGVVTPGVGDGTVTARMEW